jgi:hypothetical protein
VRGVLLQAALVAPLGHGDGMICTMGTYRMPLWPEEVQQDHFGGRRHVFTDEFS